MRAGRVLGLLALAAGALACAGPEPRSKQAWPGAPVVLISIDTLRSDRLPAYGYRAGDTPALDALRADSILFERAYSHAPLTLPAHASVFTGVLPDRHGVRDNLGYDLAPELPPLLSRVLKNAGYATGAAVSAFVLRREAGLADGFDFYDDAVSSRDDVAEVVASRRGPETLEAARPWLSSVADDSFFFFFHLYEPHAPYEAPEPLASRFDSPYDAEVAAADRVVGDLIAELERLGVYDRAVVMLISDHGEGLGDHGEPEHGILLYREILQVPLLLKLPDGFRAGDTVADPVQLVDVYPTIKEIVGLPATENLEGASLLDPDRARQEDEIYAETFYPRLHYGWSELTSLIRGPYQFIDGPRPELYDLVVDPGATRNLVAENRRVAGQMRHALREYDRELRPPGEVDAETRRKLTALGYMSSTVTPGTGPLPNPVDRLPTLEDLWTAQSYRLAGRFEESVAAARRAVEANPLMVDGWEVLGNGLENLGRFAEALEAYTAAIGAAGPTGDLVLAAARMQLELGRLPEGLEGVLSAERLGVLNTRELGRAGLLLAELGLVEEALELLRRTATETRPDSIVSLARVLSEAGRQEEALLQLERVFALEPESARAYETAGLVYLRLADWSRARELSRRALAVDSGRADAWNNLGVAHYFLNQPAEAVEAWREAVDRDPGQFEALFNIGLKAPEIGDLELARWALEGFMETAPKDRHAEDIRAARALLEDLGR